MSSAYNSLAFRIALGDDLVQSPGPFLTSSHPSVTGSAPITGSFYYENGDVSEIYSDAFIINSSSIGYGHSIYSALVNPPNVGTYTEVTSKIRIPSQSLVTGSMLSPFVSIQEPYDPPYTKDLNYLEVAISPQNAINDDIINDLGYFNIDDFIGDPGYAASSSYADLDWLRQDYFKKYIRKQNILDTIKLLSYYDNSLFKMIKDFVPAKVRLATGLTIKPHLLERSKYPNLKPQTQRPEFSGSMITLPYLPNLNQDLVSVTGSSAEGLDINTSFTQSIITPSGSITTIQQDRRETITGEYGGSVLPVYNLPSSNIVYEDDDQLLRTVRVATDIVNSGDAQDKIIPFGNYQTKSFYDGDGTERIQIKEIPNPGDSKYVVALSKAHDPFPNPVGLPLVFSGLKSTTVYNFSTWVAFSPDYDGDRSRVFFGYAASTELGANVELSGKTGSLIETTQVGGTTWYHYGERLLTPANFTQSLVVGEEGSSIPGYVIWNLGYPVDNTQGEVYFTNVQLNEGAFISERIYEPFKQPLNPFYQNITSSRKSSKFLDVDYSYQSILPVNQGYLEGRLLGTIAESSSAWLNAPVQESNYTAARNIIPRYLGTKTVSKLMSEYTPGDNGYGRLPNIGQAKRKFGYFQRANIASSGSFLDRTQLTLKYLIDGERNITELTQDNENLFEVQQLFNNTKQLVLSLNNPEEPYNNNNLNGSRRIYAGGFRFDPSLVSYPSQSQITQFFDKPIGIQIPNIGTEDAPLGSITLGNYNFDQVTLSPNGRTTYLNGQVRVPISRTQLGFQAERLDKSLLAFVRGNITLNFNLRVGVAAARALILRRTEIIQKAKFSSYLGVSPTNITVSKTSFNTIRISITYNFTQKDDIYVEIPSGLSSYLSPLKVARNTINDAQNIEVIPSEQAQLLGKIELPQIQTQVYGYNPANFFNNTFLGYNPFYNSGYTSQTISYDIKNAQTIQGNPSNLYLNNIKETGILNKIPAYLYITGSVDTGSTARGNNFYFERNPNVPYQMTASINLTRWHSRFTQTGSFGSPFFNPTTNFEIKKGDIFRFSNIHDNNDNNLPIEYEREVINVMLDRSYLGDIKPSGSTVYEQGSSRTGMYTYADTRLVIEFDSDTPIPPQACYDYDPNSRANPQYINQFIIYKKIPDETSIVLDYKKPPPPSGSVDDSSPGFILPKFISKPLRDRAGNIIKNLKGQNLI